MFNAPKSPEVRLAPPPPDPLDPDEIARRRRKKERARVGRRALRIDNTTATGGSGAGLSLGE